MNLKQIIGNPILTFFLGLGIATLFFTAPLLLIAIPCIIAIILFAFRDKIDFDELLDREPRAPHEPKSEHRAKPAALNKCLECGAVRKHMKTCSKYKARTKPERSLGA